MDEVRWFSGNFFGIVFPFLFHHPFRIMSVSISQIDQGSFSTDAAFVQNAILAVMDKMNLGNGLEIVTEPVVDSKTKEVVEVPRITVKSKSAFATVVSGTYSADGKTFNKTGTAGWVKVRVFADGTSQVKFDAANR